MTLPEPPEYDDRDHFGLVMPFVCVETVDGPYQDVSFVAGFQAGRIDHALHVGVVAAMTEMVYAPLRQQLDLIAMRHGYRMDVLHETEDGVWLHVGFTRVDDRDVVV